MAVYVVNYNTNERPGPWWEGKDLTRLLPKLSENIQAVAEIYEIVESLGLDPLEFDVQVRDGLGWAAGSGNQSADVDIVITAPYELLKQLVSGPLKKAGLLGQFQTKSDN